MKLVWTRLIIEPDHECVIRFTPPEFGDESLFTGSDLRAFREARGWTLRQFSGATGVSVKTLQVIEKEDKPVPLQLRLALAALKAGIHPIESGN